MSTDDKILNRVKKLLALSEQADSPEEAGVAFAHAQKLIAKHCLSEEQIRQARMRETGAHKDEPIICRIIYTAQGSTMPTWIGILAHTLNGANGCVGCYTPGIATIKQAAVQKCWGRESDVTLVEELLRIIAGQIDAMCDRSPFSGRTARNNFRLGAVSVVCERIRRAAADAKRDLALAAAESDKNNAVAAECTALAIRTLENRGVLALAARDAQIGKLGSGRSSSTTYDSAARDAGKRAGASVSINRTRAIGN